MSKPIWVLETNVFAEVCFDQMVAHFEANDIEFHTVRIIPFSHEIADKEPVIDNSRHVIAYGSLGIQKLCRRKEWYPGVWNDDDFFNYAMYTECQGDLMLNHDMVVMPISKVGAHINDWPSDAAFFIKPNGDTKEFAGTVLEVEPFMTWLKNMRETGYLDDTDFDVIVAPIKKLGCEWRAVVVGGKISSCSIYRQYGIVKPELHIIPEVEAVINAAIAKWEPAPVYVIDVCQVHNGDGWDYKIIEYNTFNSAGLYACDVAKIIDDVNALVERGDG